MSVECKACGKHDVLAWPAIVESTGERYWIYGCTNCGFLRGIKNKETYMAPSNRRWYGAIRDCIVFAIDNIPPSVGRRKALHDLLDGNDELVNCAEAEDPNDPNITEGPDPLGIDDES